MQQPFLIGIKLYLRPLSLADLDGPYLNWLNDPQTVRFLDSGRFPTTRQALEESIRAFGQQRDMVMLAIVDRRTHQHIGNIKLGPINWIHRYASIGLLLGDSKKRGKGFGHEAVALVLDHAFKQLGLHKVTAGAYDDHDASLALFTRMGFVVEGRQRGHLYREGVYHDKVVMGLLSEEYLTRPLTQVGGRRRGAGRRMAMTNSKSRV